MPLEFNDVQKGLLNQFAILLCFLTCNAQLFGATEFLSFASTDTLIIDGDTIFIERQEGMLISDSTGLSEPGPSRLKRPPLRIWNAAIAAGFNTSLTTWESLTSDFQSLDEFLGRKTPPKLNPLVAAEFGGRFAAVRTSGGTFELSVNTGIALNQVVSSFTTVSDFNQLAKDSVLGFGTEANELLVTYFTLTNPPDIGEVDTAFIDLQAAEIKLNTLDIPLKLRVTLQPNGSNTRMFLETGVMRRLITQTDFTGNLLLLNERGEYHPFLAEDFITKRILTPHFALGVERRIPLGNPINQQFYALGALLSASLPGLTWNNSADLSLDVGSVSITAFARFFF